jgi:hypothetical protein
VSPDRRTWGTVANGRDTVVVSESGRDINVRGELSEGIRRLKQQLNFEQTAKLSSALEVNLGD